MDASEVGIRLRSIEDAAARFRVTLEGLSDEELTRPSLCEGWTRGHVLAHIALNAHSIVNLISWARTGKEIPQYASREQRNSDIERFSTRSAAEHLAAFDEGNAVFHDAAVALPPDRWGFVLSGIAGNGLEVSEYLIARRNELEIHHVDLDAGYGSKDWPQDFVRSALEGVQWRIGDEVQETFRVEVSDLDTTFVVGKGDPSITVSGDGHTLLLWFVGRSRGDGLVGDRGYLPELPSWG